MGWLLLQWHKDVSGVCVSGTELAQIIGPGAAGGVIFHSPRRAQRTSGLMHPAVCPRP